MAEAPELIQASGQFSPIGFESALRSLRAHGLAHRVAEDERFDGRLITLGGRPAPNFGSCSYLGLETEARTRHRFASSPWVMNV